MLDSAAAINPKAFTKLERVIGRHRSARLLTLGLDAWRKTAGAAAETQTFGSDGAGGKATFGIEKVEGDRSGFKANASAEMTVTRAAVENFSSELKDKLPSDVTGASAKVDVSFEDVAAACPNAKDGADGNVSEINNVDVQTTFQTGGTGNSTETYRARLAGSGFGKAPPPIPGQPGPSVLGATPITFEPPATGGVQVIGGGIDVGGDGIFPTGSLLVSRSK